VSSGTFRAQVRDATFDARDDLYLLLVAVDSEEGIFDSAWACTVERLRERDNRELSEPTPLRCLSKTKNPRPMVWLSLLSEEPRRPNPQRN
jgi:hypothetical protein